VSFDGWWTSWEDGRDGEGRGEGEGGGSMQERERGRGRKVRARRRLLACVEGIFFSGLDSVVGMLVDGSDMLRGWFL